MGKIQFGSMVTAISGKIGGQVYSRNKAGAYVKNKVIPTNPNTPSQVDARQQFAMVSAAWKALTRAVKRAWITQSVNYPRKDALGNVHAPSGFNFFMSLNGNLATVGAEKLVNPPSLTPPPDLFDFNMDGDISATMIEVFESGMSVPADTSWVITMTPLVAGNINTQYISKSKIAVIPAGTVLNTVNLWADYVAKFGLPAVGQKAGFEVWAVHNLTGVAGYHFVQECYFGA